ncbi:RNA polymerase [Vibrio phage pVco-7]
MTTRMLPRDYQMMMETKYSKSNIRKYILDDIQECQELMDKLHICALQVEKWCQEDHYESKKESLAVLLDEEFSIKDLLVDIMSMVLTQSYRMEITSAVGLVAGFMPWEDYRIKIKRAAELLFHLAACDIIDMAPAFISETNTVLISNKYSIGGDTAKYIEMSKFTPPMVCVPEPVKSTRESGYLTKQQFAILKGKHQHNYPVNLASINNFNSIPLSLDHEFLRMVEDELETDAETEMEIDKRRKAFDKLRLETYDVCLDIIRAGNEFYETHFWCGRGRTYTRGYHINSQGNSYRKAMVNYAEAADINEDIEDWKQYF